MGNYLSPISPWAKTVLEEREKNKLSNLYRTPFAVMTSAALVAKLPTKTSGGNLQLPKPEDIDKIVVNPPADAYKGCIISNNINNIDLSYSTNETIVGVDFDGKLIKVEGETGRKVSTPIITSIDVDTEEANNTLKTTRIGVKCFTLKQLEMFEMFFMKPNMSVLVEWGDSSLLKRNIFASDLKYREFGVEKTLTPYSDISEALFINQVDNNWEKYCNNFSDVFTPGAKGLKNILERVRKSIGSYDFAAGRINDYTFTFSEDGTYDITLTIFQANQVSLALPVKPQVKVSNSNKRNAKKQNTVKNIPINDLIIETIITDFNLSDTEKSELTKYSNEWFNFDKRNDTQTNTQNSSEPYVSLYFILKYLVNALYKEDELMIDLPIYKNQNNQTSSIVPFHYNKHLISSDENIIFPSKKLLLITTDGTKNKPPKSIVTGSVGVDATINGKSIELEGTYTYLINGTTINDAKQPKAANALNCFILYKKVVDIWTKSLNRAEFIKDILRIVNSNSYGLTNLVLQSETQTSGKVTVMCSRFAPQSISDFTNDIYRFKPTTINSTVKNFNFTFQMDNAMASKTIFNSGAKLRQAFEKESAKADPKGSKKLSSPLPFPSDSYRSFEYSAYANADGFFAINNVDRETQQRLWQDYQNKYNKGSNVAVTPKNDQSNNTTTKDPEPDPTLTIKSKSKTFTIAKKQVTLIYLDKPFIQSFIDVTTQTKSILTNIAITVVIDGFSGLRAGEVFHVDGVPEIYNQQGAFQITNIKHNLTPDDGWNTIIEASWRIGVAN